MSIKLTPDRAGNPVSFDRPCLAFVEGVDDQAVVARQIALAGSPDEWQVHSMGGNKTSWGSALDVALSDEYGVSGRALALIQDADTNADAVVRALRVILSARDLPEPSMHGEVAADQRWRIGLFVLPDGVAPGALEDLLLRTVDPVREALARSYIAQVTERFRAPKHPSKNAVLSYIAGHFDHVRSLPVAVAIDEIFPPEAEALEPLRAFIRRLEEPSA